MNRRSLLRASLVGLLLLACRATAGTGAEEAAPGSPEAFAQRVWRLTDVVLEQHFEPPARQQMLLAGTRALLARNKTAAPADLSRRASGVTTPAEFTALLREFSPQGQIPAEGQEAFLAGLCAGVPGPAQFLGPDEVRVAEQISGNRYEGTGIQVRFHEEEKLVQIMLTFPGSPARRAGMKAGDLILAVDGVSMEGKNIGQVVKHLRGAMGEPVDVTVRQPGTTEVRHLHMVRDIIPFELVVGYRRVSEEAWDYHVNPAEPIAYVRVTSLTSSTLHELRQVEPRLQAGRYRALVLDLRFINGGDLQQAGLVADGLLADGVLWRTRDAKGYVREWRADRESLFRDWPVAVLIASRTAGVGPEMLAAALQDNRRAVLVGEATAGRNRQIVSQVVLPEGEGALRLWTGVVERARPLAAGRGRDGEPERCVVPEHGVSIEGRSFDLLAAWNAQQERGDKAAANPPEEDRQLAKALDVLRAALQKAGWVAAPLERAAGLVPAVQTAGASPAAR
jgi:C-terminal peptidase prc